MKFAIQLLSLVAISSVAYSYSIPLKKRSAKFHDLSKPCLDVIDSYNECMFDSNLNQNNLDSNCKIYESQKCQNFYKTRVSGLDACKNENSNSLNVSDFVIDTHHYSVNYYCARDEDGNICPLSKYNVENMAGLTKEQRRQKFEDALNASCRSKTCLDAYQEMENQTLKLKTEINVETSVEFTPITVKINNNVNGNDKVNVSVNGDDKVKVNVDGNNNVKVNVNGNDATEDVNNTVNNALQKASDKVDESFQKAGNKINSIFSKRDLVVVKYDNDELFIQSVNDYLKSDKCTTQTVVNNSVNVKYGSGNTSGANTLSYKNGLLVALVLVLYTLLL